MRTKRNKEQRAAGIGCTSRTSNALPAFRSGARRSPALSCRRPPAHAHIAQGRRFFPAGTSPSCAARLGYVTTWAGTSRGAGSDAVAQQPLLSDDSGRHGGGPRADRHLPGLHEPGRTAVPAGRVRQGLGLLQQREGPGGGRGLGGGETGGSASSATPIRGRSAFPALRCTSRSSLQALQLRAADKHGLVARSRCYLKLGDVQNSLKDAEASLQNDKTFSEVNGAELQGGGAQDSSAACGGSGPCRALKGGMCCDIG